MSEFREGAKIRREVRVAGVNKMVSIEISEAGVQFWVKGSRKRTTLTWRAAAAASQTGQDVPSFLMDKPIELLQYQAKGK